jgi:hypothetical protein
MASARPRGGAKWTAAAVLIEAAGCAGLDADLNPFYVGRVHETRAGSEARALALGPFWDDARALERRETALHPLWRRVRAADEVRVQVLDPLFASRYAHGESQHRLLPFVWARTRNSVSSESEFDFMLFPLIWAGFGPSKEERYFALVPLAGQIKSFAGFAEAGFALFPLYYYVRKEVSEPETLHHVTPFVRWVNGGPRDGSWHLLPLAGHWKYEGKHDKWTFLWPIVHVQRNRLDSKDPTRRVAVWPLFSRERGERTSFWSFLWPFFRFRSEREPRLDEAGKAYEEVYYHQDFLWPLFRRAHTREFDHVRLFPFWSRYHSDELDSEAFAIPFLWVRQVRDKGWTKDTFDFVPIVHWERKRWTDGAQTRPDDSSFKLWPLFQVKQEGRVRDVRFPVLLPLDTALYAGDFEANWSPLWELWHVRSTADGWTRGNALLRLVDWESRGGRKRFSVPLLYSYDATPRRTTHSLLLGLLRFGGGVGGAEFKLLGMPILSPEAGAR